MHDSLEWFKDPKNEHKNLETAISLFFNIFDYKLKDALKDLSFVSSNEEELKKINEWYDCGEKILRSLHKLEQLENAKVLFVEHPLLVDIDRVDNINIKFKGFIDIVISSLDKKGKNILYLCDYKTCSWGWGVDKKTDETILAQLRLYKHFFCKKFNLNPDLVKTAYILLKKKPSKNSLPIEWVPISVGNKTMMRTVLKINKDITEMNCAKTYKQNINNCIKKYGEKEERCPYYRTEHCSARVIGDENG